ncbi:hypothetical protein DK28_0211580 [Peptococcaceae bacterium SCADC1_2_3]|jgi:glycosyltransferase involved in cell wall biosynthesis|nr:hypothetical protein DK28_0211580 [Peptococcaceae bacterium SCADC1_2_3]KFI35155.1 hypothetical protein HY00_07065 [Peptococcaceae bacterium SCADC1_2_3]
MRVILVPLEDYNVRSVPIINDMAKKGVKVLGVERALFFNTKNEVLKHFRFMLYLYNTLFYGLKHRKKIDLILSVEPSFGIIGAVLSVFIRKPVIWDTHDGNILAFCQLLKYSFIYTKLNLLIEKFIGRIARTIIVPSEIDKQLYIEQKFKYKAKIKVIPSGINLSKIDTIKKDMNLLRRKLAIKLEKKILIFSGGISFPPNKEAAFWINDKLAPALVEKFSQVQIIITGSVEVPQKIHPNVTFVGHVPDYFEHILASDVCLVPYEMNTGISTKLIDYLACGRPTVTTVEVARLFPELVDGENVLIARDKKEFIEKTMAILENPVLGEKIGANGRKVIEVHYNIEVIGKLWQEVFESCVSNPKPFI